jgi:hypothetical protein
MSGKQNIFPPLNLIQAAPYLLTQRNKYFPGVDTTLTKNKQVLSTIVLMLDVITS